MPSIALGLRRFSDANSYFRAVTVMTLYTHNSVIARIAPASTAAEVYTSSVRPAVCFEYLADLTKCFHVLEAVNALDEELL